MGSNLFSDMLKPLSDFIEGIPIVGPIIEFADKIALNTDPSQLLTAGIGKLIGGDTEEYYTSEEARKGASHNIGLAALAYLLGGAGAGGASASGEAGAGAVAAGEAGGAGGTAVGSVYAGEAGATVTAEQYAAAAYAGEAGGAGGTATGSITATASEEALKNWALNQLQNQAMKQVLAEATKGPKGSTTGGSSNTRVIPRQSLQPEVLNKLMGEALGPDDSSATFDSKGVTLKAGEGSALYKRFLSGEGSLIKSSSPLTSMNGKGDLAFKTSTKPTSLNQVELQDTDNEFSGMRNMSLASPFYQPTA